MSIPQHEFRPWQNEPKRPFQFSIRDLLLWTTGLCVVLGVGYSWGILGGYLALVACVSIGAIYYQPSAARVVLIYAAPLVVLPLLILPVMNASRSTYPRRYTCSERMREIAVAINNYAAVYTKYPPSYTVDAAGNRLHSWRTLILPFLEESVLHEQIDFTQPWDSPANAPLTSQPLSCYQCPAHPQARTGNFTTYVAVVGPGTMWPDGGGLRWDAVQDGEANTILVIEITRTDIAWAEPRDLTVAEILAAYDAGNVSGIASFHEDGRALVGFCDVHHQAVDLDKLNRATLRAMLTPAGGEAIDLDNLHKPPGRAPRGRGGSP